MTSGEIAGNTLPPNPEQALLTQVRAMEFPVASLESQLLAAICNTIEASLALPPGTGGATRITCRHGGLRIGLSTLGGTSIENQTVDEGVQVPIQIARITSQAGVTTLKANALVIRTPRTMAQLQLAQRLPAVLEPVSDTRWLNLVYPQILLGALAVGKLDLAQYRGETPILREEETYVIKQAIRIMEHWQSNDPGSKPHE